MRFPA